MNDMLRRNFAEVHPGLTPKEAMEESNRCLYCYDAPCIKSCPTGIDIPSFIKKISTGNLKGSARVIMDANPVGATCSRVCPTEQLCEGACVLNGASQPIRIGLLQRYATDAAMKTGDTLFAAGPRNGRKAAVVGSGPAGLSAARELARFGYAVTVYEAKEKPGGLDTYGIVSFRLPQDIPMWEADQLSKMGVAIRTGVRVGTDVHAEKLLADYDAVVLAAGMGRVPALGIEGEQLDGVYDAIELIESTKADAFGGGLQGARVIVIGAGNTAIDAATCSVRLGADNVKIVYRRTRGEMTAYDFEYRFAKEEGVEFRWLTAPKRIVGNESGKVTHLECVRMTLSEETGKDGRPIPVPVAGSEFLMEADAVIKAIGQKRLLPLIEAFGLEHERGVVTIDPVTYRTSHPKVYAAGDVVFGQGNGEATVVSAAQQGKLAAYSVHRHFGGISAETA
ncbi:NAD(P)-dependent oxidoreductase [Paenibacillus alkalitolerans]|uniref:NAD(P)-dependent oxidoreductase n=1 Tax=Paenibacillus alkalitolerans TaxID=2799335 RepID=UPI0018F7C1A4|nr:NAD(P)-dependent oxidoreductase [Paenibacillus alkalitolerans]